MNDAINRCLAVLSYPFVSIDFLEHDFLQEYLDRKQQDFAGKREPNDIRDKRVLRKNVVEYVRKNYSVFSYDEIYLYLDKWYLYPRYGKDNQIKRDKESFYLIFERLKELSRSLVSQRDGQIIYKYWENEGDRNLLGGFSGTNKIYLFHSMNRLFPLDILVILYMINSRKTLQDLNGFYGNIKVSDALLDQVLKQGLAENHLHSGVSGAFLSIWDEFMKPLTVERVRSLKKFNPYHSFDLNQSEIQCLLWLAGAIRVNLLIYVKQFQTNCSTKARFKEMTKLMKLCIKRDEWKDLPEFQIEEHKWDASCYFLQLWDKIIDGKVPEQLIHYGVAHSMTDESEDIHTSDEELFLFYVIPALLKYRESTDMKQARKLFLHYLRIKNFFYGLIVQQKTVHGLDYFTLQYYKNNSDANKSAAALAGMKKWERAIREQLQNEELKKIELRASIDNNESDFRITVKSFLGGYREILRKSYCTMIKAGENYSYKPIRPFPQVGLVMHLLKSEQGYFPEKCIRTGEEDSIYLQYGKLCDTYKKQIEILKLVRRDMNGFSLDKYLVGLDVASLENAVPTWVFSQVYEAARDSKEEPLKIGTPWNSDFQSLGFTFHAGEDYRHLLSGLRRIEEVIRHLKFHAGDRIGHGIALGISAELWYRENSTVIIPRGEALDNYLWSYDILSRQCSASMLVNLAYLEKRIYELAKEIYGDSSGLTTNLLADAYRKLFSVDMFKFPIIKKCQLCGKTAGFPEKDDDISEETLPDLCSYFSRYGKDHIAWNTDMLITARHCKWYVHKMNEPIHYRVTDQEFQIVCEIQKAIKQYVMQQGIVIEVNPSSNVTIGNIDTLADHQVYNMNHSGYDMENIITCINSDDPSVFNTNVYNELAYIYFSMIEKGMGREDLLKWIDKLRKSGMDASFIRRTDSDEQILHELDMILED